MAKHICNKTNGVIVLMGGVITLQPKGAAHDSLCVPDFSLVHSDVKTSLERDWVEILTPQQFRALQSTPDPVKKAAPAPVEPVEPPSNEGDDSEPAGEEDDETPESEEDEETPEGEDTPSTPGIKSLEEFLALSKKKKSSYIKKLGLHGEVDRRYEDKMDAFYAEHYAAQQ